MFSDGFSRLEKILFGVCGLFTGDYCRGEPVLSGVWVHLFGAVWAFIMCFCRMQPKKYPIQVQVGRRRTFCEPVSASETAYKRIDVGRHLVLGVLIDSVLAGSFVYAPN